MIPCGDKIFIRPDPIPEKTKGGIIKPQTTFVELVSGTVEAVHKGYVAQNGTFVECQFRVGDKVYYQAGQAVPVEHLPEDLVMVMEAAIVMREEREDEKKYREPADRIIGDANPLDGTVTALTDRKPDAPGC